MTNDKIKPPKTFWVIGIIALLWNLMGAFAYLAQAYMSDEALAALPEAERALYENVPAWATAAFATAVFGGVIACILLLLRRKSATLVFIISLIGIIVQMVYNIGISKAAEVYGPGGMLMPAMVILIGIFLVWYSKNSYQKGWIA
jgi:hypothetical protein